MTPRHLNLRIVMTLRDVETHDDSSSENILNESLKRDIVWAVVNGISTLQVEQPLIGSWDTV